MPDPTLLLSMSAMLLVIGAFAGVLAGLLGVGGGIVLVPAFFYAFTVLGYDSPQLMQMCLGTSLATIIVTSLRSVLAHNKKGATFKALSLFLVLNKTLWCELRSFYKKGVYFIYILKSQGFTISWRHNAVLKRPCFRIYSSVEKIIECFKICAVFPHINRHV